MEVTSRSAKEPPNFRESADPKTRCGTCEMFDHEKGVCWGYGNKPVDADDVCDSWSKETKTSSILQEILSRPLIPLEQTIKVGGATADWGATENGTVALIVQGGDYLDRQYARDMLTSQLLYHGYRLAEFIMPMEPKTAEQTGWTDFYHATPRSNRESIQNLGLMGDNGSSPWDNTTEMWNQPKGNYFFDSPEDAITYAKSTYQRKSNPSQEDEFERRFTQPEPPQHVYDDDDVYDQWMDENPPVEREDDPEGWDVWKVNTRGLPIHRDPETALSQGTADPQEVRNDFNRAYDNMPWGEEPTWEDKIDAAMGWSGGEPRRYYTPEHIEPERLQLHQHIPMWDQSADDYGTYEDDHPQIWDAAQLHRPMFPSHSSVVSSFEKMADWNGVMQKAKRLAQSGNVRILRNGYNYVVANVQGDHDNYEVEISRQDPSSRAITGWSCTCQWADHSFDRTRKWRKYESRPCSHVLATYWRSLATPLDDAPEGQPPTPGQRVNPLPGGPKPGQTPGQAGPSGHGGAPLDVREPASPQRSFGPDDEGMGAQGPQPGPMNMPQGPSSIQDTPIAPSRGIIPPYPGEQMQQWENWQGPGTTDGGQESPPWAVSVPGAKQPTPFNPLQWPGTYSSWKVEASYQIGDIVQLTQNVYMNTDSNLQGNWQLIPARKPDGGPQLASVRDVDPTTGFIQIWVSLDNNSYNEPAYAYGFVSPNEIKPSRATTDPTAPRRLR